MFYRVIFLRLGLNNISNLTICWAHTIFSNIATGISTKQITLPVSMYVYGESVSSGTRIVNLKMTAYNYNNDTITTQYTVGFQNTSNSQQSGNVYIMLVGKT